MDAAILSLALSWKWPVICNVTFLYLLCNPSAAARRSRTRTGTRQRTITITRNNNSSQDEEKPTRIRITIRRRKGCIIRLSGRRRQTVTIMQHIAKQHCCMDPPPTKSLGPAAFPGLAGESQPSLRAIPDAAALVHDHAASAAVIRNQNLKAQVALQGGSKYIIDW